MTAPRGAAVPVQDAVFDALAADVTLRAFLTATVQDARIAEVLMPPGTSLWSTPTDPNATPTPRPYVTIGGGREASFDMLCEPGFEDELTVRVWVPGTQERLAKQGFALVRAVLNGVALPIDGHVVLLCRVGEMSTEPDPDRKALQARGVVSVVTQEAA